MCMKRTYTTQKEETLVNRIIKFLLTTLILLACHQAETHAQDLEIKLGQGLKRAGSSGLFSASLVTPINEDYFYRAEIGYFSDNRVRHSPSLFSSVAMARRAGDKDSLHFDLVLGIALISNPDELLGSPFEFTEEIDVGYKNVSIGVRHFSNAGIVRPNIGRDYLLLNYGWSF